MAEQAGEPGESNAPARIAAGVAIVVVIGVVAAVLLLQGSTYRVHATFTSASQLVKGNLVQVAGEKVGQVEEIKLTDDGRADVTLSVEDEYAPLRSGTRAIIRQLSLSGIANRYVD